MAKLRTRVVVSWSGIDKELLSITERPNGDLVIAPKDLPGHGVMPTGLQIRQKRYSIHRSQKSSGFLIKQTYDLSDGSRSDGAQFRRPGPDGNIALVFTKTVQRLDSERFDARPQRADRIVNLYEGDIDDHLLFYSLIVTEPGKSEGNSTNFKKNVIRFRHFDLVFLSGFFPLRAPNGSDEAFIFTSIPRTGRADTPFEPPQQHFDSDWVSESFADCCIFSKAMVAHVSAQTCNRFLAMGNPPPDAAAFIADVRKHVIKFRPGLEGEFDVA